eukprot:11095032-Karenia_brevis.AAC.1
MNTEEGQNRLDEAALCVSIGLGYNSLDDAPEDVLDMETIYKLPQAILEQLAQLAVRCEASSPSEQHHIGAPMMETEARMTP